MEILGLVVGVLGLGWAVYVYFRPKPQLPLEPTEENVLASSEEVQDWISKQNRARIERALVELAKNGKHFILPFALLGFFFENASLVLLPILIRMMFDVCMAYFEPKDRSARRARGDRDTS